MSKMTKLSVMTMAKLRDTLFRSGHLQLLALHQAASTDFHPQASTETLDCMVMTGKRNQLAYTCAAEFVRLGNPTFDGQFKPCSRLASG
jgi:hypothetical protein